MINIIKESFLYKFFYNLIILPYENSFFKKCTFYIKRTASSSKTNAILYNYTYRKPFFLTSYSYKFFRKLINFFNKIADFLNKVFKALLGSSKFLLYSKNLNKYSVYKNVTALNLCISGFLIGYSIGLLVVVNSISVKLLLSFFYLIIICIFLNKKHFKNSITFRLLKSLYRLVKV